MERAFDMDPLMPLTGISLKQSRSPKQDTPFPQGDHRAQFHSDCPQVAEECDKEFLKNTTTPTSPITSCVPTYQRTRRSVLGVTCCAYGASCGHPVEGSHAGMSAPPFQSG